MRQFDVIIIGAGVSGLYFSYRLKQISPDLDVLVLERNHIGGRAGNELFYGANVVTGAGIGRYDKDKVLLDLVKELKLETHDFMAAKTIYGLKRFDAQTEFARIKKEFKLAGEPRVTFKKFAKSILGANYRDFLNNTGYTDYENEDCYEVLNHYNMIDNFKTFRAFSIPWSQLVQRLATLVGNIKIENVQKIKRVDKVGSLNLKVLNKRVERAVNFEIYTDKNIYQCAHLVIATDADSLNKLLKMPIYRHVKGQPFIRTYGKFTKESTELISNLVKSTVFVKRPLQKIIPMSAGVFMIAYADNQSAVYLKDYAENSPQNCAKYADLLFDCLGLKLELVAIRSFYWQNGTHYFSPYEGPRNEFLSKIRCPEPNIYVIGEAVSRDQGWTKGAIDTANLALKHFVRTKN